VLFAYNNIRREFVRSKAKGRDITAAAFTLLTNQLCKKQ